MSEPTHAELRELLGSYALDQLDADERALVDAHLAGCADCRAELSELAPVVAALQQLDPTLLDPTLLDQAAPPAALADQVVDEVGRRRRLGRRRTRVRRAVGSVLVAASVAAAFALGGWWFGPRTAPPVIPVAMSLDAAGLTVDAGLVRHTWGTELKLRAAGLEQGASYAVVFVRDDGSRVSAGSLIGTGANPLTCSLNAALSLDEAAQVLVTAPDGSLVMEAAV